MVNTNKGLNLFDDIISALTSFHFTEGVSIRSARTDQDFARFWDTCSMVLLAVAIAVNEWNSWYVVWFNINNIICICSNVDYAVVSKLVPLSLFATVNYTYVLSFDLVLQLMVANNVPFYFAVPFQFIIEDGLTIALLILYAKTIKQQDREHLMVSKGKKKQTFSEIAFNLTVATICAGCQLLLVFQILLILMDDKLMEASKLISERN